MWDAIAYKTMGDEAYTDRIMKLNPEYRRLFVFPAGIVLTIPEPESQVAAGLPPWKRGNGMNARRAVIRLTFSGVDISGGTSTSIFFR